MFRSRRAHTSTHILNLDLLPTPRPKVRPQHAPEQLGQHCEADARDGGVVAPFTQLVADEGVLRPRRLVEREDNARLVQRLADEVAARGRHVVVHFAEDLDGRQSVHAHGSQWDGWSIYHDQLPLDVLRALQAVVAAGAQRAAVDVGREVADAGGDAWVECAAVGEVAA
jgi:hypothetical protein